jgi:hypothetical protein
VLSSGHNNLIRKELLLKTSSQYIGLDILLQLNGEIFPMENGFWTKIEVKLVIKNEHIPHGIKYSLTLHDRNNIRILGYDNAHGIKPKKKKYGAKKITCLNSHIKCKCI